MRDQVDRYFELLPVLLIALLVLLGERGAKLPLTPPLTPQMERPGLEIALPPWQVEAPRLIFR